MLKSNINDYLKELRSEDERERLWAITKIEEKFYASGVENLDRILFEFVRIIEEDESTIVRAHALRALYHPSSETWPLGKHQREKILWAIRKKGTNYGSCEYGLDGFVARNILDIEKWMNWLE